MNLQFTIAHLLLGMLLSGEALGNGQTTFLEKYKKAIQDYTMTGHESGWNHCDILSEKSYLREDTPQITMDFDKIRTMDIRTAFVSSHCLLVNYRVISKANLSALIDFGWAAIQHIRLALVIKMEAGISLDLATNTTKLPFLVAAESDQGIEQFLCPVVGEAEPRFERKMCKKSYRSQKNRTLRIGIMGMKPYFVNLGNLGYDGMDIRMLKMLEKSFKFETKLIIPPGGLVGIANMVSIRESCIIIIINELPYFS